MERRHLIPLQKSHWKRTWLEALECNHLVSSTGIKQVQLELIFVFVIFLARRLGGLLHEVLVARRIGLDEFFQLFCHFLSCLVQRACHLDTLDLLVRGDIAIQCREDMAGAFNQTRLGTLLPLFRVSPLNLPVLALSGVHWHALSSMRVVCHFFNLYINDALESRVDL